MLSENMASLGGEQVNSTKDSSDSASQRASRPSSLEKKIMENSNSTIHWFAQIGDDLNSTEAPVRDRDEKLRLAKERQNEERQRKIEELKAQAEAAQRYREQKEEERKRRIEELRSRDSDRRHQVEERKKAIIEAEKERREYILRKNQVKEREARLDAKKRNERSSGVFAFGSSTPRLLDPSELGNVSPSAFWGHRRSTSITNVAYTGASLTRRSSERDLADGSKKRATSAGGIDRQLDEDTIDSPPISYRSVARRKTDLMPTIPSPREPSFGSKTSLQSHTPRTPGSRSGEVTPGGSINTSRPGSAMSTSTTTSVQRRSAPPARKPRPASIAVTGVSLNEEGRQKKERPPLPKIQSTPKRTSLNNNLNSIPRVSSADSNKQTERKPLAKRDSTPQKSGVNVMQQSVEMKTSTSSKIIESEEIEQTKETALVTPAEVLQTKEEKDALNAVKTETTIPTDSVVVSEAKSDKPESDQNNVEESSEEKKDNGSEKGTKKDEKENTPDSRELSVERQENEMTASMIARSKITTEEEAKAALAEKRRLAREEAERQAELERQRLEAERQAELQRQAEEEERLRKLEEDTLRLAEEQRKGEEERLRQAIEETRKKEESERLKREEEEKMRVEKEEADKKAKEEAEKQRLERLKREEKEREERRKRVEAIMSRTRAKGGNGTPNSTPTKDSDNMKIDSNEKQTEDKATSEDSSSNDSSKEEIEKKADTAVSSVQQHQHAHSDKIAYEQSVTDKENALMKTFSNMIIDENAKNLQIVQNPLVDFTNGKVLQQQNQTNDITSHTIANGNGHIENLNKNDTNVLVDVSPVTLTDQLIDISNESQQITDAVNFTNNNSLLTSSTTLVNADSHESNEISLL